MDDGSSLLYRTYFVDTFLFVDLCVYLCVFAFIGCIFYVNSKYSVLTGVFNFMLLRTYFCLILFNPVVYLFTLVVNWLIGADCREINLHSFVLVSTSSHHIPLSL